MADDTVTADESTTTEAKPAEESKPEASDEDRVVKDDDWQTKARKHERAAKREQKRAAELEQKLKERDDADKSEQEKALDKARAEAKAEAKAEAETERRADRLEVAVTRAAARGIELSDEQTARFADSDDALLYVERAIAHGDVDADEIFDSEGKVNTDALSKALAGILRAKPHLAAGEAEQPKPKGDADAGKGSTAEKSLEDMTAEEHFQRIRRHK